jgi:hypothetical protein
MKTQKDSMTNPKQSFQEKLTRFRNYQGEDDYKPSKKGIAIAFDKIEELIALLKKAQETL